MPKQHRKLKEVDHLRGSFDEAHDRLLGLEDIIIDKQLLAMLTGNHFYVVAFTHAYIFNKDNKWEDIDTFNEYIVKGHTAGDDLTVFVIPDEARAWQDDWAIKIGRLARKLEVMGLCPMFAEYIWYTRDGKYLKNRLTGRGHGISPELKRLVGQEV